MSGESGVGTKGGATLLADEGLLSRVDGHVVAQSRAVGEFAGA